MAALPFGIWFFLGIEGVPLAAEEAKDPRIDIPCANIGAMLVLIFTGLLVLIFAAGVTGASVMVGSSAPLVDALNSVGNGSFALFVNVAGLFGLAASFFSLIYAGSREVFALSRAGYLPTFLSLTGERRTPGMALLLQGGIGFLLVVLIQDGDLLMNMAVLGACISYAMVNLSHIVLRLQRPNMERPYRTPGGKATTGVGLTLSCVAIASTFFVDTSATFAVVVVLVLGVVYFSIYAKKHLVGNSPEEEFDKLRSAGGELKQGCYLE